MKVTFLLYIILFLLTGCNKELDKKSKTQYSEPIAEETSTPEEKLIKKEGMTIGEIYNSPKPYMRIDVSENSFGEFLRNQKLKPYVSKVPYH